MATTKERVESVEACIGILTLLAERQDVKIVGQQERVESVEADIGILTLIADRQQKLLEEVRRDSQQTHRLWVRLCKKYGWLDDEDL